MGSAPFAPLGEDVVGVRVVRGRGAGPAAGAAGPPAAASAGGADQEDEDTQNQYSSLTVEGDEADDSAQLPLWGWRWLGRILALRVPGGVVYIGPHWFCSVLMLAFIVGVGGCYCCAAAQTGPAQLLGGIAVTVLSTLSFLRCSLADPGVLEARKGARAGAGVEAGEEGSLGGASLLAASLVGPGGDAPPVPGRRTAPGCRRCARCDVVQPRGCSHCEFCQVCVEGFDHHCPWMGKCIGKKNLCAFYTFIAVSMSSLGYIFIATMMTAGSDLGDPKTLRTGHSFVRRIPP